MDSRADQTGQGRASRARRRRVSRFAAGACLLAIAAVAAGFVFFLSGLSSEERRPERNADGIVVLTGGSSRVADAMELLASGYGKRLLISGVYPANRANDIGRSIPERQSMFKCCVDLDHSAVNTRSNAAETKRWANERGFRSLIVVTSNYHMPRAIVEMSHSMPDITLIPFAVIGDKWRDEPWWSSAATFRLLLVEYVKYLVAEVRVRIDWVDVALNPGSDDKPRPGEPAKRSSMIVAR
jgi:uncharacterized SAM-binding protein YcdF (DUF218 family)